MLKQKCNYLCQFGANIAKATIVAVGGIRVNYLSVMSQNTNNYAEHITNFISFRDSLGTVNSLVRESVTGYYRSINSVEGAKLHSVLFGVEAFVPDSS